MMIILYYPQKTMPEWINIIGPADSGKTSLINFLKNQQLPQRRKSSFFQDYFRYRFRMGKKELAMDLCDNPGQQEFRRLVWTASRNCKAFILIYDLSSYRSFEEAKKWLKQLRDNHSSDCMMIFALGNKRDLPRQIDKDFVSFFWQQEGIQYTQISMQGGTEDTKQILDKMLRQMWLAISCHHSQMQIMLTSMRLQHKEQFSKIKKKYC